MHRAASQSDPLSSGKRWERWIGFTIAAAALVVIAVVAISNWAEWSRLVARARLLPLIGALAAAIVGQFLNTVIAHESLKVDGSPLPLRAVYRIIAVGGLAKFIPGGVWQVGSQYGLGRAEGLGFRTSMLAWIEPTAFNVTVGGGLALLAATTTAYGIPAILLVAGALLAFAASTNPIRYRIYRMVRLVAKNHPEPARFAGWPLRFGLTVGIIALTGLGGMLVIVAFGLAPSPGFLGSVAAFVGAWVIGVLVFPVPGGLGIREGALVIALAPWIPASEAVLVATASRLVAVAAELGGALIGLTIRPGARDRNKSSHHTDAPA